MPIRTPSALALRCRGVSYSDNPSSDVVGRHSWFSRQLANCSSTYLREVTAEVTRVMVGKTVGQAHEARSQKLRSCVHACTNLRTN